MNKFSVTIQPIEGSEVSYKVGGFDRGDAWRQGVYRWYAEDSSRMPSHIADVFVEPLVEQPEADLESRLLGRTA